MAERRALYRALALLVTVAGRDAVAAGHFPMFASWPQAGGPGTPLTLTYSFSNLFDGNLRSPGSQTALAEQDLRAAFTAALWDYAEVLPLHFLEVADRERPATERGEYDPLGHAQIRIGQMAHIDGANAYAYFPLDTDESGLAGDIVFNAERFGSGWTLTLFYAVAQHELGHTLGMGHFVADGDAAPLEPGAASGYEGPLFPLDPLAIASLQAIYGVGRGSVTPIPLPTSLGLLLAGSVLLGARSTDVLQLQFISLMTPAEHAAPARIEWRGDGAIGLAKSPDDEVFIHNHTHSCNLVANGHSATPAISVSASS